MPVTETIHSIKIPFQIPVAPDRKIDRVVYAFVLFGEGITLIDSGVSGSDSRIFDSIRKNGRDPEEIQTLILSHSHPDHIGSARTIKEKTSCRVLAHAAEKSWIEDTEQQARERPVPGFNELVDGPVAVDALLADGEEVALDNQTVFRVLHTPGHSAGSLSLSFPDEKALFTGDALPLPGDLPIYDDIAACMASIRKIFHLSANAEILLSSWEAPVHGNENILKRIKAGASYLERIHEAVLASPEKKRKNVVELCQDVVGVLGLPPFAANPLVARTFASSLRAPVHNALFKL